MPNEKRLYGAGFIAFLESRLEFDRWDFRMSFEEYVAHERATRVIYDSEWCRVKFVLYNVGHFDWEDELSVWYGRLHAHDKEPFIVRNGELCRCWHYSFLLPVQFLEGHAPEQLAQLRRLHGSMPLPSVLEAQMQADQGKDLGRDYPPSAVLRREALIWTHYGARLFELFDLRRPDIWESYQHFVEEYYRLDPLPSIPGDTGPPHHKIC